jgi:hypothetical protein
MLWLLVAAAAVGGARAGSLCDQPGWTRLWEDDFNGDTLNLDNWSVVDANDVSSCREAYCTPANVAVANGNLVLTTTNTPMHGFNYSSAAVNTRGKKNWNAATSSFRTCVSAKLPGCVAAARAFCCRCAAVRCAL